MRLIILAAGQGTRLGKLTAESPKCLVEVKGKSILEYQLETAAEAGISDLHIVTGYRAEKIEFVDLVRHHNSDFTTTNMVSSLFCAESIMTEDLIISYGDIIYKSEVLNQLIEDDAPLSLIVDRDWRAYWEARMPDPLSDAESLKLDEHGDIIEIGRKPRSYCDIEGQYIGLIKIGKPMIQKVREFYHSLDRDGNYEGKDFGNMYMTTFIQRIIDELHPVRAVFVKNGWMEVDCPSDIEHSQFAGI